MNPCRVVLVEPHIAGNIGATARVMRNFGLSDLVLVNPRADHLERNARQLSTHGEEILHAARVVADLGEAVADCAVVAATSARIGGLFRNQQLGPPAEIMPRLAEIMIAGNKVALVFGPEETGLSNTDVARCHWLIHIPTDATYPALNLAQSVGICLYALTTSLPPQAHGPRPVGPEATFDAQERMFDHLRQGLEAIHFLYGPKADSLMHALRHLLGRAKLSEMEVDLLHGLARQMLWVVQKKS